MSNNNNKKSREGRMKFKSGCSYAAVYKQTDEGKHILEVFEDQPVTTKVAETREYLGGLVNSGVLTPGSEVVLFKAGQHRRLRVTAIMGALDGDEDVPTDTDEAEVDDDDDDDDDEI